MLKYEVKSVWEQTDAKKQKIMRDFAKKYMKFISENKTERECVAAALKRLQEAGFCSDFETGKYVAVLHRHSRRLSPHHRP